MKLKNKSFKIKLRDKIGVVFILIFIGTLYIFFLLNKHATPILMAYAELETTKLATLIINKAVQNHVDQGLSVEELLLTTRNSKDEIISVDFDTFKVNQVLNSITNTIQANLKLLEEGKLELLDMPDTNLYETEEVSSGILYYIPFGVVTDIPIIADIGPKIPIKTNLVGSVISNVKTEIVDYGINNALLKVYIEVTVSEQVILPFISKRINTQIDIPVMIKLLQGNIPSVYGGLYSTQSPIVSTKVE